MPTVILVTLLSFCLSFEPPESIPNSKRMAFENALQATLISAVPTPLIIGTSHWGDTVRTPNGMKWKPKPEVQYADKNHGTWRKYAVTLKEPIDQHFKLQVQRMQQVGNNTLEFELLVSADIDFDITQQNWKYGLKLFDGSARGSATIQLWMKCHSKLEIETSTYFLPTMKYRLHVVEARAGYEHLKLKHLAAVGGTAAKLVGDWTMDAIHQWKPSLERKLVDKFTQKLIQVADTREIQISLSGIERNK